MWYVATLQGQACPWYSCRQQNIHRAVGMSGMPLFTGGRATRAASCVSICMSLTALAPQHGTHCGSCPLACLSSSSPQQGVPTCLSTRGEQSQPDARNYIISHNSAYASPSHVMGIVYGTQSQDYENSSYQAPPRLWEHCSP